jgi:hypothetical protein
MIDSLGYHVIFKEKKQLLFWPHIVRVLTQQLAINGFLSAWVL